MIKTIALACLLLPVTHKAPLYAHSNKMPVQATITVYSCRQKVQLLRLYEDGKGTIPMANPFVTDRDGLYSYFVSSRCLDEVIIINGKLIGTIESYSGEWPK